MSSIVAELSRRKVFRSAALYLAAAWLILQVADLILEAFDVAPAALRLLIVGLAIGFPLFLLVSWFYERRGARLVRDTGDNDAAEREWSSRTANATIAVLVFFGIGIYVYTATQSAPEPRGSDPASTTGATIAVLPLSNISSDPADAYLADGLTEELLNVLSSVPELQVTARASSFALRDTGQDVRSIGEQLGVDHVIGGSVRKAGDQLRIAVQLDSTITGQTLWSSTYDRELTDIFDIQKDIADRVSGTLQLSLFSDPVPIIRRTTPEAYAAYLRALQMYRAGTEETYAEAAAVLEKVIAADENYAPAWTLLASVRQNQAIVGAIDYVEANELARTAINRALELDPNYAYAISSRAWFAMSYERDFETSARYFGRALELAPNDAAILGNRSVLARLLGRPDRAIELTQQSIARNPLAATNFVNLSDQLYQARRFSESIEAAERALELSPGRAGATINLAVSRLFVEDPDGALGAVMHLENPFYVHFVDGLARYDLGDREAADAAVATLIEGYADQRAAYIAAIYAYRGENDLAFDWLARAIEEGQRNLAVRTEPLYDNLRDDPRWQRVLERLGLSDQQIAHIDI